MCVFQAVDVEVFRSVDVDAQVAKQVAKGVLKTLKSSFFEGSAFRPFHPLQSLQSLQCVATQIARMVAGIC